MFTQLIFTAGTEFRLPRPGTLSRRVKSLVTRSNPDAGPLNEVMKAYDLQVRGDYKPLSGSQRTEVWMVRTSEGRKVLKKYKKTLDHDQVLHEHSILVHLNRIGFPVPRLYPDRTGQTIVARGDRLFALSDHLDGYAKIDEHYYFGNTNNKYLWLKGKALGMLHQGLADFVPEGRNTMGFRSLHDERWQELDEFMGVLDRNREITLQTSHDEKNPLLNKLVDKFQWIRDLFEETSSILDQTNPPKQLIHGDYGPYNILVKPGEPLVVIDFEFARIDWRLIDLTAALSTATQVSDPDTRANLEKMERVVKGYHTIQLIPSEEYEQLPAVWQYYLLRRIILCWDRFNSTQRQTYLDEADKRLERLDWVIKHRAALVELQHVN